MTEKHCIGICRQYYAFFSLLSLRGLNLRFTILPKPNQFCNIANSYNFQKKEQHSFEPRLLSFCVPIPCISKKYPICSMHKSRLYGYTWLELKRLQTLVALLSIFDCISWYVIRKVFGYFSCKLSDYHTIWSGSSHIHNQYTRFGEFKNFFCVYFNFQESF